jgi:hypothetical protein
MTERATGGCLCGAVRYRVDGRLRPVVACHCKQCRRQTGHHYAATAARRADVTISGLNGVTWYRASGSAERGFCATCGSALFWAPIDGARLGLLAGSLDDPTGLQLAGHIFVADKGDYYTIADGLPQRAQAPDGDVVADLTGTGDEDRT